MVMSLPHLAHHFPVIGPGCIQQQKRVTCGRCVHNDKMVVCLFDDPGECLKHGNLFSAWERRSSSSTASPSASNLFPDFPAQSDDSVQSLLDRYG
jgi:hypothetical protein